MKCIAWNALNEIQVNSLGYVDVVIFCKSSRLLLNDEYVTEPTQKNQLPTLNIFDITATHTYRRDADDKKALLSYCLMSQNTYTSLLSIITVQRNDH